MNPLFAWIVAHTAARATTRICARCGRVQTVARDRARDAVACTACGALMAPPPSGR